MARLAQVLAKMCVLVIGLTSLGCGSEGPTQPAPQQQAPPVATTMGMAHQGSPVSSWTFSELTETVQLTATVMDQYGATMSGQTVTWSSSDDGVATVSSDGLVTSVWDGPATITALSGSVTGTLDVSVELPESYLRLRALSAEYGPILSLHPSEAYMPSSVEWYVAQTELAASNTALKCEPTCDRFGVAQAGDSRQDLLDRLVSTVNGSGAGFSNLWLETPDLTQAGDLAGAKAYVHVLDLGAVTDIQYWFFYPFNGAGRARVQFGEIHDETSSLTPLGEHYGDWEAVILRFNDATDELLGAFMSSHGDYNWYPAGDLAFENGHVLAFASYNGHAIYPSDQPHDQRVVHAYAGWRNQCIGGELWGHCVGYRTDVGIGTLDVDLLNTTGRGQSLNAYDSYQLVATDGIPIPGEEWVDVDIRWGQQRSGGATDVSDEQFQQIMEDQVGIIALVSVAGAAAACNPLILAIPVVGAALCATYLVAIVPALIVAFEEGAALVNAQISYDDKTFNGPKTPGAKGDEYFYTSCPKEGGNGVVCPAF